MFLDIHRPVFIYKHSPVYFLKHNVSETGFCLRVQVKPTQLGPIDRASVYTHLEAGTGVRRQGLSLSTGPNWVGPTWRRRQNPVSETLCFEK
jgi:hypothetical protein